jgi:hypothetical protein
LQLKAAKEYFGDFMKRMRGVEVKKPAVAGLVLNL